MLTGRIHVCKADSLRNMTVVDKRHVNVTVLNLGVFVTAVAACMSSAAAAAATTIQVPWLLVQC